MTKWPTQLLEILLLAGWCACLSAANAGESVRAPSNAELDDLVEDGLPRSIPSVKWQANEPPQTNLFIYGVRPKTFQSGQLKTLAEFLGVRGEVQKMPAKMTLDAPGYWIKEPNPTNPWSWKSVWYSERSGSIGFGSGEDNHGWGLKNHKPLAQGVPDEKEALQRTLALLPVLGITTNDLAHFPDGRLKYACNTEGTWYNDRHDNGGRKRYIRQINIEFWQKIQDGASVLSIGGGGILRVGYISDGRLAEIEMTFRSVEAVGQAAPKTSVELIQMLKHGVGRSFHSAIPDNITITNSALVYPEANSATRQDFLWPFYSLSVISVENGETNEFQIYEPLEQK